MKKTIITIERQYGSGGSNIGKLAAEKLGISCYNRQILEMTAERCGIAPEYLENAEENVPVPASAVHKYKYSDILPCRILGVCHPNDMPGDCMSFAPRMDVYGICATCKHSNQFHDGFCLKENHAEQRRVFYGKDYGGDERKIDYYGRHRLSVCDDYAPDEYVKKESKA